MPTLFIFLKSGLYKRETAFLSIFRTEIKKLPILSYFLEKWLVRLIQAIFGGKNGKNTIWVWAKKNAMKKACFGG